MRQPGNKARRYNAAGTIPAPRSREQLLTEYGHDNVWDTTQLARDFIIISFTAPIVVVKRKSDGALGYITVQDNPRLYFGFQPK